MSASTAELLQHVQSFADRHWPGRQLLEVQLALAGGIRGAFTVTLMPAAREDGRACSCGHGQEDSRRHRCARDILLTLAEVGEPLTFARLADEMALRKRRWGETTVKRHVAVLMRAGEIENPVGSPPRGYRLCRES